MDKNYKELYPKDHHNGFLWGEKAYEAFQSREEASKNLDNLTSVFTEERFNNKIAFIEGFYDGYEEAEASDYRCCFKEQENE